MPGFNLARKVEVGSQNNDCGLNCLAHVLSTCVQNTNPEAKNALLEAYKKQYGAHFTWDDILRELNGLSPRKREQKFSPVLRTLYATAYQAVSSKIALPQFKGQPRASLAPNSMISDEELNILGYYFGLNVESYVGNIEEDLLAARGVRHGNPIGTLKLWMPTADKHNHYSFELPASMDLFSYNNADCIPVAMPAVNTNKQTNTTFDFDKKIDTWFSALDSMFNKIFPAKPATDASNIVDNLLDQISPMHNANLSLNAKDAKEGSWLGSIKSFFSFLTPIIKMFMGFAAMFAGNDETPKANVNTNAATASNVSTTQAKPSTPVNVKDKTKTNAKTGVQQPVPFLPSSPLQQNQQGQSIPMSNGKPLGKRKKPS